MLSWLDDRNIEFPPIEMALDDPNGLLAAGGDLRPERLIEAYRQGIFPWYEEDQPILWWSPNPRAVLFPDRIHISKSLKKTLRKNQFKVTADIAFSKVVLNCANVGDRAEGTWITDPMMSSYNELHQRGVAHSIEVWFQGELVGGLYGLCIGQLFFGESMFSKMTDASKVAFVFLSGQLQEWGVQLIDCQVPNDHLTSLGSENIGRDQFKQYLKDFIDKPNPATLKDNRHWMLSWQFTR